jgi:hypothetical protein
MRARLVLFTIPLLAPAVATAQEPSEAPVGSARSDAPAPIFFTDITGDAGIHFRHSFGDRDLSNIVEGTGPGVAFFDYNGDTLPDLYFLNGAWHPDVSDNRSRALRNQLANALYRNDGDGTFTDVTVEAGVGDKGYGMGAAAADYDRKPVSRSPCGVSRLPGSTTTGTATSISMSPTTSSTTKERSGTSMPPRRSPVPWPTKGNPIIFTATTATAPSPTSRSRPESLPPTGAQ